MYLYEIELKIKLKKFKINKSIIYGKESNQVQ